jgi:hypothetical protein
MAILALLVGCAGQTLSFSPDTLDFGEVDFAGELPEEGYAVETVTLTNDGSAADTLSLQAYDQDHLCLAGFTTQDFPVDLGSVSSGGSYTFRVGVCAYVSGEVDTEVSATIEVEGDNGAVSLPVTFTPVRSSE